MRALLIIGAAFAMVGAACSSDEPTPLPTPEPTVAPTGEATPGADGSSGSMATGTAVRIAMPTLGIQAIALTTAVGWTIRS